MKIHLIDGTYELFRNHFGAPPKQSPDGQEIGATLGLLRSLLALLARPEVTHVACAFDHVIESFRNDLYPGYKTSAGIDPDLLAQFPLAEEAVAAVEQIVVCSPDKDLTQLVSGNRIVCWDRRRDIVLDAPGVVEKFGVGPLSIPDWLALVGDAADGYPGIPGWGAKSASTVLARYEHLESIPNDPSQFGLGLGRAARLAENLAAHREEALLYRKLATLREDVPLSEKLDDLEWQGARSRLKEMCEAWGVADLPKRISRWS